MISRKEITELLLSKEPEIISNLYKRAADLKLQTIGPKVHLRGLIEISNICRKNCLYCGIRKANTLCERYTLTDEEIMTCAKHAYAAEFGSIVIQGGERTGRQFTERITSLVERIKFIGNGALGITLSLGEQSEEVYKEWFEAGAHRYLLRIETSDPDLFRKIHPNDGHHTYDRRIKALMDLKSIGYQAGSGVMIGLPWQNAEHLASDLLFLREMDFPMIGMGPYVPHDDTPLTVTTTTDPEASFPSVADRLELSLKMISLLRILVPDINIAASTALEALHPKGRIMAIHAGANIVMPNITPSDYRKYYNLYDRKAILLEDLDLGDAEIGFGEWGDSLHFFNKV
ncbi:MAG: [FeFe] hydrogenase H-cluster radical SAM maturase HydE [Bacteroidales bacterium]|jgi:biotin synthase|nr:[FeFe] hydrogenase H-cluster radical SAM maturase HydE [Bacteroidales bacterium]